MITTIDEHGGIVLEPGTLYVALARLEQQGLIVPLESVDQHRPYCLTECGYAVLQQSLATLHEKLLYHALSEHPIAL